jgi:hypothetical protein
LAYDGERADAGVLDQLEAILRHVADELATWRSRALKAEGDLKEGGGRAGTGGGGGGGVAKADLELRGRAAELEQENKQLRLRVEAAKGRVQDLVSRLAFLEEQARETVGSVRGGGSGSSAGAGSGSATGSIGGAPSGAGAGGGGSGSAAG